MYTHTHTHTHTHTQTYIYSEREREGESERGSVRLRVELSSISGQDNLRFNSFYCPCERHESFSFLASYR